MLFLLHLVRIGLLTAGDLVEVLEAHYRDRPTIGSISVRIGAITPADVARILEVQRKTGCQFGEVGVSLGLLTPGMVARLLSIQTRASRPLLSLVVEHGYASQAELDELRRTWVQRYQASRTRTDRGDRDDAAELSSPDNNAHADNPSLGATKSG